VYVAKFHEGFFSPQVKIKLSFSVFFLLSQLISISSVELLFSMFVVCEKIPGLKWEKLFWGS